MSFRSTIAARKRLSGTLRAFYVTLLSYQDAVQHKAISVFAATISEASWLPAFTPVTLNELLLPAFAVVLLRLEKLRQLVKGLPTLLLGQMT